MQMMNPQVSSSSHASVSPLSFAPVEMSRQPISTAPVPPVPAFHSTPSRATEEALALAKLQLDRGRTTILDDHEARDEAKGRKAQNALALISDYGMDSDEDDEEEPNTSNGISAESIVQKNLNSEDPLASFFDELQHEGLLEEEHEQRTTAAGPEAAAEQSVGQQKVIEWLSSSWALVEDTSSSQRYHWNCETNEVSWEAPDGCSAVRSDALTSEGDSSAQNSECKGLASTGTAGPAAQQDAVQEVATGNIQADVPKGSDVGVVVIATTDDIGAGSDRRLRGNGDHAAAPLTDATCTSEDLADVAIHPHTENASASIRPQESNGQKQQGTESSEDPSGYGKLPEGWVKLWDEDSSVAYYWHQATDATQWEQPVATTAETVQQDVGETASVTGKADKHAATVCSSQKDSAPETSDARQGVGGEGQKGRDVWVRMLDEESGREYFWHEATGGCEWEAPKGVEVIEVQASILANLAASSAEDASASTLAKPSNSNDAEKSADAQAIDDSESGKVPMSDAVCTDAVAHDRVTSAKYETMHSNTETDPKGAAGPERSHTDPHTNPAGAQSREDVSDVGATQREAEEVYTEGAHIGATEAYTRAAESLAAAQDAASASAALRAADAALPRLAVLQAELAVRQRDLAVLRQCLHADDGANRTCDSTASATEMGSGSAEGGDATRGREPPEGANAATGDSAVYSAFVEGMQGRAAISAACVHITRHILQISKEIPAAVREFMALHAEEGCTEAPRSSDARGGKIGLVLPSLKRKRDPNQGSQLPEFSVLEDGELPEDADQVPARCRRSKAVAKTGPLSQMHDVDAQPPLPLSPASDEDHEAMDGRHAGVATDAAVECTGSGEEFEAPPLPEEPHPSDEVDTVSAGDTPVEIEFSSGCGTKGKASEPDGAAQVQATQPPLPDTEQHTGAAVAEPPTAVTEAAPHTSTAVGSDADAPQNGTSQKHRKRQRPTDPAAGSGDGATGGVDGGSGRKHRRSDRRRLDKKGGKANALVNKWQNVAKELEEDNIARLQPVDLEARHRTRTTDVQEWVADQHRSGAATSNPNFIPISNAWRDRVASRNAARAEAAAAAEADAAAARDQQETLFFENKPDLDVLSVGLPEHWRAMWDANTKGVYYGNLHTKDNWWRWLVPRKAPRIRDYSLLHWLSEAFNPELSLLRPQ